MANFEAVFGVVVAICLGVMFLTVFFKIFGYFNRLTPGYDIVKVKTFVNDGKLINLHFKDGKSLLAVRFIGFMDREAGRTRVPHQLANLLVLETAQGSRILVRPDSVKMIEEIDAASGASH